MDDFLKNSLFLFFRRVCGLSSRETQVAFLVVEGHTNKEIGQKLCVAEKTIKFHVTNIYRKSGIKTRVKFSTAALKHAYFSFRRPPVKIGMQMGRAIERKLPENIGESACNLPIGKGVI